MAVFWVVALCNLVEVYRRFRGSCCPHHEGDLILLYTVFVLPSFAVDPRWLLSVGWYCTRLRSHVSILAQCEPSRVSILAQCEQSRVSIPAQCEPSRVSILAQCEPSRVSILAQCEPSRVSILAQCEPSHV
jgi:hypothetical protein